MPNSFMFDYAEWQRHTALRRPMRVRQVTWDVDFTEVPAPRRTRWLWEKRKRDWVLLGKVEGDTCAAIANARLSEPHKLFRLTKTNRPPRSVDTPEIKDPFT